MTRAKTKPKAAAAATDVPKIEVILDVPEPKKHSIRYQSATEGLPLSQVYVSKSALASIGTPSRIKVTIESAE